MYHRSGFININTGLLAMSKKSQKQDIIEIKEEEAPNKGYSFIVGIIIGIAIIVAFALLFH